jgi:hypothetical protein
LLMSRPANQGYSKTLSLPPAPSLHSALKSTSSGYPNEPRRMFSRISFSASEWNSGVPMTSS